MAQKKKSSKPKIPSNASLVKAIRDDLLNSIKPLFEEQRKQSDEKFEGIEKRLDGMDKRFDTIDNRLDGVDKRFDTMENRTADGFGEIDRQLKVIRVDIHDHAERIMGAFDALTPVPAHGETIKNHEERLDTLE